METLSIPLLRPQRAFFEVAGGGIEAPRPIAGSGQAINMTGGGAVQIRFENCRPHNDGNEPLRYLSRIAALLNGGTRTIWVPVWNDLFFPSPATWVRGDYATLSPFDDGETFNDGGQFAQPIVASVMAELAALNATTVTLYIYGSSSLIGGEIFGVEHAVRGKRVYAIYDIVSQAETGSSERLVTATISPPLREAVAAGEVLNFFRPECEMRLAPGTTVPLPIEVAGVPSVDISFVESSWAA